MPLKNPFKLQKLQIKVYGNRMRVGLPKQTLTVMFNPTSVSTHYKNVYSKKQGVSTSSQTPRFIASRSTQLKLDLVLDGTGVTDFGISSILGLGTKSVGDQIDALLKACMSMDGDIHEPKYLKLQWGDGVLKEFDCRLEVVNIEYTAFERSGAPLHAVLKTTFLEDVEPGKRLRKARLSSPDLSHTRIVKSGDTLPLLTREIYGSARYYLRVAQVNQLDDFRNLVPGQTIFFPPLDKLR
ncbi:MAG: LysM peptidoglycan-binding domain-containing protein [Oscillochloris sp.]|nr:LysM peptidoglycan-binding domain-containing protein [Oscillochloris sp.]